MLIRPIMLIAALLLPVACGLAQEGFPDKCSGSQLPFDAIKIAHPIDSSCGLKGKTTSKASQVQNLVKNNFCVTASSPEAFTRQMLVELQSKTHISPGHLREPEDRKPLEDLGEKKLIRMKAFLIEAHHADLGGESVNCNGPSEEDNDIHIAFGEAADTQECASVSAEISPHYRPSSWNEIGHFETFNKSTKKYTVNPGLAARLQAQPCRITGQLFLDASHTVCPCGTNCVPLRSSLWEIHPVYGIEVCKTGTPCNGNSDGDWMPFDTWWKNLTPLKTTKNSTYARTTRTY